MRVLVADDNPKVQGTLKNLLAKQFCVVDTADSLELDRGGIDAGDYDLIIGDLTGQFNEKAEGRVVAAPTRDIDTLFTQVAQARGHESNILRVRQGEHTLELDMMARVPSCTVNGEDVSITAKYYKMLRLMMLNPNECLGRDEIEKYTDINLPHIGSDSNFIRFRNSIHPISLETIHGKGFLLRCDDFDIQIIKSHHGLSISKDGAASYEDTAFALPKAAMNTLTQLLNNGYLEKNFSTTSAVKRIRQAIAAASQSDAHPKGLDFIEGVYGGGFNLRDKPVPYIPRKGSKAAMQTDVPDAPTAE